MVAIGSRRRRRDRGREPTPARSVENAFAPAWLRPRRATDAAKTVASRRPRSVETDARALFSRALLRKI